MLSDEKIRDLALIVAKKQFGDENIREIAVEAALDSWQDEVVRLTISLADGAIDGASDDAVLNTLVGIRRQLEAAGEIRRPTVNYDEPENDSSEEPEAVGGPGF